MRWVMDRYLLERAAATPTGQPTLEQAARAAGHEVHVTGRLGDGTIPDLATIPFDASAPVVTFGSHQFVAAVERARRDWTPGAYHRTKELAFSSFAAHLGGDILLNDDFVVLPYAEVKRRRWGGAIFLRPDAVTKAFSGFVIPEADRALEFATLDQTANLDPEMLVVVASTKPLRGEFRFVIVGGEVVTGSEYRWDDKLDIRVDVHPACEALAWEVARHPWQPDVGYTCDVALTERDGVECARVVELNTLSCSGLYACDTRKIVAAVARAAWVEFKGDLP